MSRSLALVAVVVLLLAGGWALWNAVEFVRCGERSCPPGEHAPIRLPSGEELPVLSTYGGDRGEIILNYLTSHDRNDLDALCTEAKEVWKAVEGEMSRGGREKFLLGPTSPGSEFLGMRFLVVPLYTCCVSTHLPVRKARSGEWSFPLCGS